MKRYDIIIAGGGMAGLSLCYYLSKSSLRTKSILLIDREVKNQNDRTWCFWETGSGPFESIIFRSWKTIEFYSKTLSSLLPVGQYSYKMLRGIDFYTFAYQQLTRLPNIDIKHATVDAIHETADGGTVRVGEETFIANYVFDSISPLKPHSPGNQQLLQHFRGWVITTERDCFDASCPRIMDFRVSQQNDCRFFYLLPFDQRTALVEYTVFSQQVLTEQDYAIALKNYISEFLDTGAYTIRETEGGVIPMSDEIPVTPSAAHVIRIGTSGGYTKPSTGYTFQRTQQYLSELVLNLARTGKPTRSKTGFRGWMKHALDIVFLNVLIHDRHSAADIFTRLFTKNDPNVLFRFMNEETTFTEDLQVIYSMPKTAFVVGAVDSILKRVVGRFSGQ
jgi:lycopene beta-cyclase